MLYLFSYYPDHPPADGIPGFETGFGILFAVISGMMLWISIDGMLPAAWSIAGGPDGDRHAGKRVISLGLTGGVILMALSDAVVS